MRPLLALAFALSAVLGSAVGATAAVQVIAQQQAPATGLPEVSGQPISQSAASGTTASVVFDRVNPSVVHIQIVGGSGRGSGSGFVIDERGYLLTNQHVVAGARTITVKFSTGETRQATVVGTDRGNDLALLKVDLPAGVPVAALGNSDALKTGETAIAIGSPFGLEQTITQGIVSAVNRSWQPGSGPVRRNLIQTDAPINPGNSGGPLLNDRAEVIGINAMIESPVEGSVGIGFAIPINLAKQLLPQLQAGSHLEPVWLGISGLALNAEITSAQNLSVNRGVLVTSIVAGGPAAKAGIRPGQVQAGSDIPRGGDIITAIDGTEVEEVADIAEQLAGHKPGDVIRVSILRSGTQTDLSVTLETWPSGTS